MPAFEATERATEIARAASKYIAAREEYDTLVSNKGAGIYEHKPVSVFSETQLADALAAYLDVETARDGHASRLRTLEAVMNSALSTFKSMPRNIVIAMGGWRFRLLDTGEVGVETEEEYRVHQENRNNDD